MKLVYIEWEDAIAQAGWYSKKGVKNWAKKDNMLVKQTGWIYKETKKHIILISRLSVDSPNKIISYGNLQKIPKTWIRKRVNLTKHIK